LLRFVRHRDRVASAPLPTEPAFDLSVPCRPDCTGGGPQRRSMLPTEGAYRPRRATGQREAQLPLRRSKRPLRKSGRAAEDVAVRALPTLSVPSRGRLRVSPECRAGLAPSAGSSGCDLATLFPEASRPRGPLCLRGSGEGLLLRRRAHCGWPGLSRVDSATTSVSLPRTVVG
jgi:hypothetical protein